MWDSSVYKFRKVTDNTVEKLLFTGGTGFLGKNVRPILDKMYEVTTCGITPDDMIKANLAKEAPVLDQHYEVVLHAWR